MDDVSSAPRLSARERRAAILQVTDAEGVTRIDELADSLGVTASTIRRDLATLTGQGKLARTYGGAMPMVVHPEASLRQRSGQGHAAKRTIGRWAAAQVLPGETVLLDAGTTTGAMAHALATARNVVVATIGLTAVDELLDADGVEVLLLGGRLRRLSHGLVGPLAEVSLEHMSFDRAFMGADGVAADRGICEADLEQTRLKELMMRRADNVYVLAHAAKLGQRPFHAWATMPSRWTLVTDADADAAQVAEFRASGVDVVVVPRDD